MTLFLPFVTFILVLFVLAYLKDVFGMFLFGLMLGWFTVNLTVFFDSGAWTAAQTFWLQLSFGATALIAIARAGMLGYRKKSISDTT